MYKWSPDRNNCTWIDAAHGFGTPGEKFIVGQRRQLTQQDVPLVIAEESGYKPKIEEGGIKRALDWANNRLKQKKNDAGSRRKKT